MNKKKALFALAVFSLFSTACAGKTAKSMSNDVDIISADKKYENATVIELSIDKATVDGRNVTEYDYTWHCDPSTVHDEVSAAPAEYYTGTKPETDEAVYIDHELYYFPLLSEEEFTLINYDGENEWACYYTDGENDDYVFATLPVREEGVPTQMMHSEEEASENKVLHITSAGTYVLRGSWKGQIKIDLGDDASENQESKVNIILDGADIECSVAPALIFESVYECGGVIDTENGYINTEAAGANVIVADGSSNYISGSNVYRMLKTKYKSDDSTDEIKLQKKLRKTDGALYSYMTMNIGGEEKNTGKLTVDSGFEGIDSELHLTFKGANITINSMDDGINVNEDHESVVSFLAGTLTINAALGTEGDGVDSNGYICVDGANINVNGIRMPDSALDSEDGIYYNSGKIIIDNEEYEAEAGSTFKETRTQKQGEFGGPKGDRPEGDRPEDGHYFGGKPDGEGPKLPPLDKPADAEKGN